ncbi:MAG: amino acid permease [Planctomycetota bacterium]
MPDDVEPAGNLPSESNPVEANRHLSLLGATGVGVGAIVGGGILALAGTAIATTGPAAVVAFAINGGIALLTAISFAEMASKFPESGGTYTFSRKVMSVEAAFTVGWVVWFASIVAAVLYAIGFGSFASLMLREMQLALGFASGLDHRGGWETTFALSATFFLFVAMTLRTGGGASWPNVLKVLVFAVLILGGVWAVTQQPIQTSLGALQPFFQVEGRDPASMTWTVSLFGLVQAMGYTFIALQGFDLIAAVGGEVKRPQRNIPRAMILSLLIALAIYLPLLLVLLAAGASPTESTIDIARRTPETVVADAAKNYLGTAGYWLVIVAAVLSMFTALQANLFAASRIALAMAKDRTLPPSLSRIHARRGTPWMAVGATTLLIAVLVVIVPDVSAAGAASSLIFLITFAIAHWLAILVRNRSKESPPPFRGPAFPLIPIVGGLACLALAIFQGIAVPAAGLIAVTWLSIGGALFLLFFARQARLTDVSDIAYNPELLRLRGKSPLVLVPIANPNNARAMISLADAMVPSAAGRVLVQTIVRAPDSWDPTVDPAPVHTLHQVQAEVLQASATMKVRTETLTTVAPDPMREIARVSQLHRCEAVVLGLSEITSDSEGTPQEKLLGELATDVIVLRSPPGWEWSRIKRVLVPVGGKGGHDHLLARLLSSISRHAAIWQSEVGPVEFVRVVSNDLGEKEMLALNRDLKRMAAEHTRTMSRSNLVASDDPVDTIASQADENTLVILGAQRIGPRKKLFGRFVRQVAQQTQGPIIVLSRRG